MSEPQNVQSAHTNENETRIPVLLKTLLGKVHANARELHNPNAFTGIVFYNASKIEHGRPDSYRVMLRNSSSLTQSQFDRIQAILHENTQQTQNNQPQRKAASPNHRNRRQRNRPQRSQSEAQTMPIVLNKPADVVPPEQVQTAQSETELPTPAEQ